jgi:hypothetical protein
MINLHNWFFAVIDAFTLYGGGKGGSSRPQVQESTSSNLPTYAKPYYQELLKQTGLNVFDTDDQGYVTGVKGADNLPQRSVAGFNPLQQQTQQAVAGMQTPEQYAQSRQGMSTGQNMGFNTAGLGLSQALSYNPTTQRFGQADADFYSNPFQQNVTNTALREARLQGDLQKQQGMLGSIDRGTFGGARQALLQAEQDRGVNQNLSDIQFRGASDAFMNAQQQFNADQARKQQAEQFGASLGKDVGLGGLGLGLDASKGLASLGTEEQNAMLARLQAQAAAGAEQQGQSQAELDNQFQNEMARENFERQQLQYYSDILRGNAGALGSTTVNYVPPPSQTSQIAGLGLAGLGLSKALG